MSLKQVACELLTNFNIILTLKRWILSLKFMIKVLCANNTETKIP